MAEAGAGLTETVTETTVTVTTEPENRSLTIKLRKRKPEKKVEWTSDTVDNEHMGRRSSKCCCIYEKPRAFGESSTESEEEEDEGCGHTHCVRAIAKDGVIQSQDQPQPLLPSLLTPPNPLQDQCSTKSLPFTVPVSAWPPMYPFGCMGDSTHGLIPSSAPSFPLLPGREEEKEGGQRPWNCDLLLFQNPGFWVPLALVLPTFFLLLRF